MRNFIKTITKESAKMKKLLLWTIVLMLVATFSLAGCKAASVAVEPGVEEAPTEEAVTTVEEEGAAVTSPLVGDPNEEYYCIAFLAGIDYWKGVFAGFQDAGNLYGVKTFYAGDPGYDVNKSVTVFEQIAAKNPAGITIACINEDALLGPINAAIAAGIEVVTYDSDSPMSERSSYLSTGNKAAGEAAARYMGQLLPDGGEVALLYSVGQQNVEERVTGFENVIEAEFPNIIIKAKVNDKGDQLEATKNLAAALQANPNIAGVFCMDGVAGVAGATAVRESGRADVIMTIGFDTDPALLDMVKDGTIAATIAQGTYNMGYWSMNFLYHLRHELPEKDLPNFVDTGIIIVTQDNVDDFYVK